MPRGSSGIPELKLKVLQKFIEKFKSPVNTVISSMFPSSKSPSSTIEWESQTGGRGMAPFVSPMSESPETFPHGVAKHSAEAANWKEKMSFGETFLNNIRKEGTTAGYEAASQRIAKEMAGLINRSMRRKEWMYSQMLFGGSLSYENESSIMVSVDYSLPDANQVTLATDYKWDAGSKKNIISDIIAGKRVISDANGADATIGICNSVVLGYMAYDPAIQALLTKSTYGSGNLYSGNVNAIVNANPAVLADILGLGTLLIYDEKYEVRAQLTGAVTKDSTVAIPVDNTADFEVGGTLRFYDSSEGTYEDETIASIQTEDSTVTVSTSPSTSYRAREDYVVMTRRFIPDDQFALMATSVEGTNIAEFKQAPYGLGRRWGMQTSRWDKEDPEVTYIRVEDKGLPVLYHRDAIYNLTVA